MLATKDYKKEEIVKSMPIQKEYNVSEKLFERLDKRYQTWKEIVVANELIAKNLMDQ